MKQTSNEARDDAWAGLGLGIEEVTRVNRLLQDLKHEEYPAMVRLGAAMWNSRHEWIVTLDVKKEAFIKLSRVVKVGVHTHRHYREGKEFPNCHVIGKFEGFERCVGVGKDPDYRYVVSHVSAFPRHPGLRVTIKLEDVERVLDFKLGAKIDTSFEASLSGGGPKGFMGRSED